MMTLRLLAVAVLQTAVLGYMVMDRALLLSQGQVITLQVEPVDPTDLLRGDYVILTYKISSLDLTKLEGSDEFATNSPVFVTLRNEGGIWSPVSVAGELTKPPAGGAIIRGTIDTYIQNADAKLPPTLRVVYGIESFFVPQGAGRPIEDERNKGNVTVDIALASDGRSAIKSLRLNGQAIHDETLF